MYLVDLSFCSVSKFIGRFKFGGAPVQVHACICKVHVYEHTCDNSVVTAVVDIVCACVRELSLPNCE